MRPLSNIGHDYLLLYVFVTQSINISILLEKLKELALIRSSLRVSAIILVLAAFFPRVPAFFSWPASGKAIFNWTDLPTDTPIGYVFLPGELNPTKATYPGTDYRAIDR